MEYIRPKLIEEIKNKVGSRPAYYIAGGTDIMVLRKENMLEYDLFVDLSGLDELNGITVENGFINIGPMTTMADLASSDIIREKARALSDAAANIGSPLIRSLATIGGNIATANPAGDSLPPIHALDTVLELQNGMFKREQHVNGFCLGPGDHILGNGEIISLIKIPVVENADSKFLKLGARNALAISKVSVAARWVVEDKIIKDIIIAMGAVGPKCSRARKTENILKDQKLTEEIISKAKNEIRFESCPVDDFRSTKDYRRNMVSVLLERILREI